MLIHTDIESIWCFFLRFGASFCTDCSFDPVLSSSKFYLTSAHIFEFVYVKRLLIYHSHILEAVIESCSIHIIMYRRSIHDLYTIYTRSIHDVYTIHTQCIHDVYPTQLVVLFTWTWGVEAVCQFYRRAVFYLKNDNIKLSNFSWNQRVPTFSFFFVDVVMLTL